MSIIAKIQKHIAAGTLYRYEPAFVPPSFQHLREVLMTEEARQQCPPTGYPTMGNLKGLALENAQAALKDFVGGELIFEDRDLKLLEPPEMNVWELRILERPQHRLFGFFVMPDTFLVTHCVERKKLERNPGPRWNREIKKCVSKRDQLVPDLPLYSGEIFEDYVTFNGVPE